MNTAYRDWDGKSWEGDEGDPRWDATANGDDPQHVADLAKEHAHQLSLKVGGYENALQPQPATIAASKRAAFSPMYYDLHRAQLAQDPARAKEHVATAPLARALATQKPATLVAAQALFGQSGQKLGTPEQIAREYMLWQHSLLPAHVDEWDDGPQARTAAAMGDLRPRPHDPRDLEAVDQALSGAYGALTRSPALARLGMASARRGGLLRGHTTYPAGNMLVGQLPGKDEKTYHDNRKTIVEEAAHSLLHRHLQGERDAYNSWIRKRTAQHPDKHAHLAAGAHEMALPERGDYTEELAHAMAHGVFDRPSMDPTSREAPSDDQVAFAGRLFRQKPAVNPALFRSFPL